MRMYPNKFGDLRLPDTGGYGQDIRGFWWLRVPGGDTRRIHPLDVVINGEGDTLATTVSVSGYIINGEMRK